MNHACKYLKTFRSSQLRNQNKIHQIPCFRSQSYFTKCILYPSVLISYSTCNCNSNTSDTILKYLYIISQAFIKYINTVFLVNTGITSLPLALQAFKFTDTSCLKSTVSLSFAEHKNPWIPLIPV